MEVRRRPFRAGGGKRDVRSGISGTSLALGRRTPRFGHMYTDANSMTAAPGRWGRHTALLSAGRRTGASCVLLSLSVLPGGSQTRTAPAATPVQAAIRALHQGRI